MRRLLLAGVIMVGVISACSGADDDRPAVSGAETSDFFSDDDVLVWMSECVQDAGVPNKIVEGVANMVIEPASGGTEELSLLFHEAVGTCAERGRGEGVVRGMYVPVEESFELVGESNFGMTYWFGDAVAVYEDAVCLQARMPSGAKATGCGSRHKFETSGVGVGLTEGPASIAAGLIPDRKLRAEFAIYVPVGLIVTGFPEDATSKQGLTVVSRWVEDLDLDAMFETYRVESE